MKQSKQVLFNFFFHRRLKDIKQQYSVGNFSWDSKQDVDRNYARRLAIFKAREDVADILKQERMNIQNA